MVKDENRRGKALPEELANLGRRISDLERFVETRDEAMDISAATGAIVESNMPDGLPNRIHAPRRRR
jgi:hypothetical protein